jgi:hypothetical protein
MSVTICFSASRILYLFFSFQSCWMFVKKESDACEVIDLRQLFGNTREDRWVALGDQNFPTGR